MKFTKSFKHFFSNMWYMAKKSVELAPLEYLFSFLEIITQTCPPFVNLYFPKFILDELSNDRSWTKISWYILLWTGVNVGIKILRMFSDIIGNIYFNKIAFRDDLMWADYRAGMDYEKTEMGDVADSENRLRNNLWFGNFSSHPVGEFFTALLKLTGYTYIVVSLHPIIVLFLLTIIVIRSKISKFQHERDFKYEKEIKKYKRKVEYLFSTLAGYPFAKEIRINNAFGWLSKKYAEEISVYIHAFERKQKIAVNMNDIDSLISFLQMIVIYVYSAYRVMIKSITVGSFSVYVGAVTAFSGSFSDVIDKVHYMKFYSKYIDDFKAYEELAKPSHSGGGIRLEHIETDRQEIRFENVSFKYPKSDQYVLKNVSITIRSGERLSVVGYNGAGKTTFIKLICRLYEPTSGKIYYNDTDISKIEYAQYMKLLSVVFQDFNIYALSVKENICTAWNFDMVKLNNAIEQSGLTKKIATLPMGTETQVGKEFDEKGIEFSGGEGQKLACARANYKDAPIVILDEPTASLDPISESNLYQRFHSMVGNKTSIYISHRLASVRFCDYAAVFVDGQIKEHGTHAELMKLGGIYSEMYTKQAESYVEEVKNVQKAGMYSL